MRTVFRSSPSLEPVHPEGEDHMMMSMMIMSMSMVVVVMMMMMEMTMDRKSL